MSKSKFREDAKYRIMQIIREQPNLSQRGVSSSLGISLGMVNYCLQGLIEKGYIKANNLRKNKNKLQYAYLLTPKGLAHKSALTRDFLRRRRAEYEAMRAEINSLEEELQKMSKLKT